MPLCVRRELLPEELQFCCSTGAFSCSDALNHPTATMSIGGSRLKLMFRTTGPCPSLLCGARGSSGGRRTDLTPPTSTLPNARPPREPIVPHDTVSWVGPTWTAGAIVRSRGLICSSGASLRCGATGSWVGHRTAHTWPKWRLPIVRRPLVTKTPGPGARESAPAGDRGVAIGRPSDGPPRAAARSR